MALINIDIVVQETERFLKVAPVGGGVELMSYKRNRTIAIIVMGCESVLIRESGYHNVEELVPWSGLQKNIKKRIKVEFPRSRKIRLVKFGDAKELERIHQKI